MLRSILVPLDGSTLAERALEYATALSIPTGARLVLVRAPQPQALDEAEHYLAGMAESLRQRGFVCETGTPHGNAATWLPQEARTRNADLIVMTTHGRTGAGRLLFGSVAESVVASSPVPVLVERAWQSDRRELVLLEAPSILVPLDGSSFAEVALNPAATLAEDLGAELILLRVEPKPAGVLTDDVGRTVVYVDRQEEWSRADALSYLTQLTPRVAEQHPDLTVRTQAMIGDAAESITATAESTGAALVFMATHGRTGVRRSILGSIAGKVLEHGTVPLVLVGPTFSADNLTAAR